MQSFEISYIEFVDISACTSRQERGHWKVKARKGSGRDEMKALQYLQAARANISGRKAHGFARVGGWSCS